MHSLCFFGAVAFRVPSKSILEFILNDHILFAFSRTKIALMAIMATETDTKIHTKHKMLMQS
jgi:hypothetical protein